MRASLVRAAMEIMYAHGCGAERTKGSWQSRSVCRGQSAVSAMQTSPRIDPLPGGSTDTRGATPPQPIPAVVSTARSAGASSDAATGSDTLCGERTKRPIS